jgi:hypothetical protein
MTMFELSLVHLCCSVGIFWFLRDFDGSHLLEQLHVTILGDELNG